jgi:hypothetical protein
MNRKLILAAAFFLLAWGFNSCESLTSCKICKQVTYVDGVVTQEGTESEYCDANLVAIESAKDIVNGNTRITWECR